MAKRKAKESTGEGATAVADPQPAEPVVMSPEEVEAVRRELADARKRIRALEKRNKAIIDAEKAVDSWKRDMDNLSAELNETRKSWKQAVERLQAEIKRNERQGELEFEEKPAATASPPTTAPAGPSTAPVDEWAKINLSDVAGFSDSVCEKLASIDVTTVGELEQAMREGKIVPQRVKGLGEKAVTKITDALLAFRKLHPVEVDARAKRCRCGAEYPGELTACPTCGGTFYERVDPQPTPPAVDAAMAEKAAVDESAPAPAEATPAAETAPEPEAGTVFDPQTRAAA